MNQQTNSSFGVGRLASLLTELTRQKESRLDTCIDVRQMSVVAGKSEERGNHLQLAPVCGSQACEFLPGDGIPLRTEAMVQLGQKVSPKIPTKFMKELVDQYPTEAADLTDRLMYDTSKRLLVRQLDGQVRALLSDRYRFIDNYDLVFQAMDTAERVGARVVSCSMSEDYMRIKLICPDLWTVLNQGDGRHEFFSPGDLGNQEWLDRNGIHDELQDDDSYKSNGKIVWPGCEISNSETGKGGTNVRFLMTDKACFNRCTFDTVGRSVHLGKKMEMGMYSDETISADSKAIMLKMQDSIKACFNPEFFNKYVAVRQEAEVDEIKAPSAAVDNVIKATHIPESKRDQLLAYFLGDYTKHVPTRAGLSQACARMSQDEMEDGDLSSTYEEVAGLVLTNKSLVC